MDKALETALERAGGVTELAKKLTAAGTKITKSAVSQWERCPVNRVLDVEAVTGVARHVLRPDIYPPQDVAAAAG